MDSNRNIVFLALKKYFVQLLLLLSLLSLSCEDLILGPELENTPINNFDLLWSEFDHYYPSFILKNINWDSLYIVYRGKITAQTTEEELWVIISDLLFNFDDLHVYMHNRDYTKHYTSSHLYGQHDGEFRMELIKQKYLNGKFVIIGDVNMIYGKLQGDSIGYIYIGTFYGSIGSFKNIDSILSQFSDVSKIIIDIRDNRGGLYDNYVYVASAFVDKKITYMQLRSRNGPEHNEFTESFYYSIGTRFNTPQYSKKTVLLTNRYSSSSSEAFALIFKHLEYSKQIGEFTAGGLGLSHRTFLLPNGWTYHMPTTLTSTENNIYLENIGVAPDIYKHNTPSEILNDYDRILEYAIQYLSK